MAKRPSCEASDAPYKLTSVDVTPVGGDLRLTGRFDGPGIESSQRDRELLCTDCGDDVEKALGRFLNLTLFSWEEGPLALLKLHGCRAAGKTVQADVGFLEEPGPSERWLERRYWGVGRATRLTEHGRTLVLRIKPESYFFRPQGGPPIALVRDAPTEVTFDYYRDQTRNEVQRFNGECRNGNAPGRLLLPYYHVDRSLSDRPPPEFEWGFLSSVSSIVNEVPGE